MDVLIPEGVGARAAALAGAGGAPTVSAPGTTQALHRSEPVSVLVEGQAGTILRPNLVGALVGKAAAGTEIGSGQGGSRHLADFVVLAGLVSARDFRMVHLEKKDRRRLSRMLDRCRDDGAAMSTDGAGEALDRLHRAAKLGS